MATPKKFYSAKNYKLEDSIGYLLRMLTQQVSREVEKRMAEHGLTDAQWKPLLFIRQGRGETAADLARSTCIDTGAVTRMLDRIEDKGLIQRVRSEQDRRVVNLALTDEGRQLADKVVPDVLAGVLNETLAGFSTAEYEQFKSLLQRALQNIGKLEDEGSAS
ncbi:MAG TPA: MarR family transcriptional regulator [Rhodocyclaceae bacterium]|nr:MarR family transcriptional regulator [Rhodocyclaceae bacterium]